MVAMKHTINEFKKGDRIILKEQCPKGFVGNKGEILRIMNGEALVAVEVPQGRIPVWVDIIWLKPCKIVAQVSERYNKGKPELSYLLMFPKSAEAIARLLEAGAEKYDYLNFLKGGKPDKEYWDAAMRHLVKAMQYETTGHSAAWYDYDGAADEGTKAPHLAAVIWNLMMIIENHPELPAKLPEAV